MSSIITVACVEEAQEIRRGSIWGACKSTVSVLKYNWWDKTRGKTSEVKLGRPMWYYCNLHVALSKLRVNIESLPDVDHSLCRMC